MTIDPNLLYHNSQVYSFILPNTEESELYWLGLLNSQLMWWFLTNTGTVLRGGYFRFKTNYLKPFPIKTIDFSSRFEREAHDSIVTLVQELISLNSQKSKKVDQNKNVLSTLESEIDSLVFQLYGLTSNEIVTVCRE
jgi:adenine-specific DNA-methyltransferase